MPSKTESGVPTRWQLTTRMPRSPSSYATRSTARPALVSPSSIRSMLAGGGVPGACSHLASPVTSYVPLVHPVPAALHTVHIPPPVAALDVPPPPAGATNVPVPVTVIFELSLARADAWPPALTGFGGPKIMLMMSHRTCCAWANAEGAIAASSSSAVPRLVSPLATMFLPKKPACVIAHLHRG